MALAFVLACDITPPPAPQVVAPQVAVDAPTQKERTDPPTPRLVRLNGFRYEAALWGRSQGLGQNGGYVAVINDKTGTTTQMVKIYNVPPDNGQEGDKQDVFITLLALDGSKTHLLITDERGRTYSMDLKTFAVSPPP